MSGAAALAANCTLPLPITVSAVDAAWLTAALAQRHPGVQVLDAQIVNVIYGTSTKIRVAVHYNAIGQQAQLPPTLIIKGGFEEHSPAFGFMYRSEMHCYRELVPQLAMNAPRCYFAGEDPNTHQAIVIMEDLQAREVRFLRAQAPLDYAQEARFLDALARFHAQWWNRPELAPNGVLGWVMTPFDEFSRGAQAVGHFGKHIERPLRFFDFV
jgi:hypothetical protein